MAISGWAARRRLTLIVTPRTAREKKWVVTAMRQQTITCSPRNLESYLHRSQSSSSPILRPSHKHTKHIGIGWRAGGRQASRRGRRRTPPPTIDSASVMLLALLQDDTTRTTMTEKRTQPRRLGENRQVVPCPAKQSKNARRRRREQVLVVRDRDDGLAVIALLVFPAVSHAMVFDWPRFAEDQGDPFS